MPSPDNPDIARVIGSDEKVRLIVRLRRHALIVRDRGAEWLPSGRVSATPAECHAFELRRLLCAAAGRA
jgi:hypothetical protein